MVEDVLAGVLFVEGIWWGIWVCGRVHSLSA